jgi:hypothetical protein
MLIDHPMKLIVPKMNCLGKKQFIVLDNLRSFGLIMNLLFRMQNWIKKQ